MTRNRRKVIGKPGESLRCRLHSIQLSALVYSFLYGFNLFSSFNKIGMYIIVFGFFFRFIAGTSEKSWCDRSEQINNSKLLVLSEQSWRTDLQCFMVLDTTHSKIQWFGFSLLGQIKIDEPSGIPDQNGPFFPVSKYWSWWWKKKSLESSTARNLWRQCRIFWTFTLYMFKFS